ncbi:hypothetical protein I548_1119 [Mycobacterium intracellulare]|nr:hypothetical protein I548_1119 [Mycobacterium intracellulare]
MSDESTGQARPLIGYITHEIAPQITPAPIGRTWMSEMRQGWPHRCLPMLIANQSGWEVRNRNAFTATWMGGDDRTSLMIAPDTRESGQFLPSSHFGYGILTWHLPMLFRTPPGYNLLVRGPANHPKDAISALEGVVETDWSSSSFSMNWKFTREFMPVRFEVDEPICMIVPQRRAELEEFAPELRPIESDEELHRKHEFFLGSRGALGREQETADGAPASGCRGRATTPGAATPTASPGPTTTRRSAACVPSPRTNPSTGTSAIARLPATAVWTSRNQPGGPGRTYTF